MATELATAFVQLQPSFRGVTREIEKGLGKPLEDAAKRSGDQAGKSFGDRFGRSSAQSMERLGSAATKGLVAFGAASAGLFGLAKAAGNLDAAIAANVQVLGKASDAVQDWAENAVDAVGLSESAALDASTGFGQLGKIIGLTDQPLADFSTGMVEAAADMAAFKDVPVDQALADLQSGFAGSTEVMRKYGIFLDEASLKQAVYRETGERVTGTLTAQQRILATHSELMRQGADMWGQWDRESSGFAATQSKATATFSELAATLGQAVLPAATTVMSAFRSGAEGLLDFNESTGGAVGTLIAVGTAGLGAASGVGLVVSKASAAVSGFTAMSTAAKGASLAFGAVGIAATAGFLIYQGLSAKQREMKARTDEVSKALGEQVDETFRLAEASADASGEIDGVATAQRALSAALTGAGEDGEKLTQALGGLGRESSEALDILTRFGDDPVLALAGLAGGAGVSADNVMLLAEAVNSTDSNRLDDLAYAIADVAMESGMGRDAARALGTELAPLAQYMEEVQDQAAKSDLDAMARTFLNAEVAAGGVGAEAVKMAQAMADLAGTGESATDVYMLYGAVLAEMEPEQRAAAVGSEDLAAGLDLAAAATEDVKVQASSFIEVLSAQERRLSDAADQAGAFTDALDRLSGGQISAQRAQDNVTDALSEFDKVLRDVNKGVDGATTSLDASTEAGRNNREMIRGAAEDVLGLGEAMLDSGASVDEASAAITWNTGLLRNQLVAFGLTESEADAYLATLGLTPENIATAVELYGDEAAKRRVEDLVTEIGEIPTEKATEIQALIDSGAYAAAERALNLLARQRSASIVAGYGGRVGGGGIRSMAGNLFTSPGFTSIAEDGDSEWVAPLEKPALMRGWLRHPEILRPVMEALPPEAFAGAGGDGGVSVGTLNVGSRDDLGMVGAALRQIEWERRAVPK